MKIYDYGGMPKLKAKKVAHLFPKKDREQAQQILEALLEKVRELAFVKSYEKSGFGSSYIFIQSSFRYLFGKYSEQISSYADTALKTDHALESLRLLEKHGDLIGTGLFGLEGRTLPISGDLEHRLASMIKESQEEILELQRHARDVHSYLRERETRPQPRNIYTSRPSHPSEDS